MKKGFKKFLTAILIALSIGSFSANALIPATNAQASVTKFCDSTFSIGAWYSFYNVDTKSYADQVRELAQAGLNLINCPTNMTGSSTYGQVPLYFSNRTQFYSELDSVARANNLYYLYQGPDAYNFSASYADTQNLTNCVGYHIKDEPSAAMLESLAITHNEFYDGDSARSPYINLFPSYAGTTNLGGTYEDYVTKWVNSVGAEKLDWLYFDHYPFQSTAGTVRATYFGDVEVIRDVGYKSGRLNTGGFTQMGAWNGMRVPTADEARWSTNSLVAYGLKSISHFCWVTPNYVAPENGGEAMHDHVISSDGVKSSLYEPMSILNWQTRQIGKQLINIDVQHAYHYGGTPTGAEGLPSSFAVQPTSGNFVVSIAYHKTTNEPYIMLFNKALSGSAQNYKFNIETANTGVDHVRYYKATDYTTSTLPDPTNLATLTDPEEQVIDVTGGSFTLSFRPGDIKLLKLEGENGVNIAEGLSIPESSHKSGIYEGPQKVSLLTEDPGASIYYTLDGSYPEVGREGTYLYSGTPIEVGAYGKTTTNTIRAIEIRGEEYSELLELDIVTVDGSRNVAFGKDVKMMSYDMTREITVSGINSSASNPNVITDNSYDPNSSCVSTSEVGWAVIDLGQDYPIYKLAYSLWHDHWFADTRIELARKADFSDAIVIVDKPDGFQNTATVGQSANVPTSAYTYDSVIARYARITTDHQGENASSWFTELQLFSCEDLSINAAQGAIAQFKSMDMKTDLAWSGFNGSPTDIKNVTDRSCHPGNGSDTGSSISITGIGWIVLDFGDTYTIDTLAYNFWRDWTFTDVKFQLANKADFSDAVEVFSAASVRGTGDSPLYTSITPTVARYMRVTCNTKGQGTGMNVTELQAWTQYNAGENILANTSSWSVLGGASQITNDGTTFKDAEHNTGNWNKGYSYNAKTYTNFIIKGTMSIDLTSSSSGFAGFQIMRESTTVTQGDAGKGLIVGVQPDGRALAFDGRTERGPAGCYDTTWSLGSTFSYAVYVYNGNIAFAINGKTIMSFYDSTLVNKSGYISIYTGTLPVTVYSMRVIELGNDFTFPTKGTTITELGELKLAVDAGTTASQVKSKLSGTITAKDNNGKTYTLSVSNWACANYNATAKGTNFYFTGVFNSSQMLGYNLSNVAKLVPTTLVFVKPDIDYSTINELIAIGDSLIQSNYEAKAGGVSVSGTWEYFQNKLGAAKDIVNDEFLAQSDVNVGSFQLYDAIYALNYIGDTSVLTLAISNARAVNGDDYTAASYAKYQELIAAAEDYMAQTFKRPEDMNAIAQELNAKSMLLPKISVETDSLNYAMTPGASIRYAQPSGIRFMASFDKARYDEIIAEGYDVEVGMIIAPYDYIATYGALSLDVNYYSTTCRVVADTSKLRVDDGNIFVQCALVNILDQNYTRRFNAVAYMQISNGEGTKTIYADGGDNVRSIYEVAARAMVDTNYTKSETALTELNRIFDKVNALYDFTLSNGQATVSVKETSLVKAFIPEYYYSNGTIYNVTGVSGSLKNVTKLVLGQNMTDVNFSSSNSVEVYVENSDGYFNVETNEASTLTGSQEVFIGNATTVQLPLDLSFNGINSIVINGATVNVSTTKGPNGLVLGNDAVQLLNRGENIIYITDSTGAKFRFSVYYGYTSSSNGYLIDFDTTSWSTTDGAMVTNTVVSNGIDGKSVQLTKDGPGGTLFGFRPDGGFGMAVYTFAASTTYTISFDIKENGGTIDGWSTKLLTGQGEPMYVEYSATNGFYLSMPGINVFNSVACVSSNGDGSYHATATFTTNAEAIATIEFSNWSGPVNILMDNIYIRVVQ